MPAACASSSASRRSASAAPKPARTLEECVGDLDARGAAAQRGERVDASLHPVALVDIASEVAAGCQPVGLVVDDQLGAAALASQNVDDACQQRVAERDGEPVLAMDGTGAGQPPGQR